MGIIKVFKRTVAILFLISYLVAILVKADFFGNLLAPFITFGISYIIYKTFYNKNGMKLNKISIQLLIAGILFWAISDTLWAFYYFFTDIDPVNVTVITYGYSMTNICLTISMFIFCFRSFRKWNKAQMLLDVVVMSYFITRFFWLIIFNQDVRNLLIIQYDWTTIVCIVLDIALLMMIAIWYMSVRNVRPPLFLGLIFFGSLLYSIVDLIYYYQYLYSSYKPNSILDGLYVVAFLLYVISAMIYKNIKEQKNIEFYNVGAKGKSYILILVAIIMMIYHGLEVAELIEYIIVILLYIVLSVYIQNNIYRESLLQKEKELNNILEQKVKDRTAKLEEQNKKMQYLLDQDVVTGLFNRRYLNDYLEEKISNLSSRETILLLYVDINRFHLITTMFGHYIGDKILIEVAKRLSDIGKKLEHSVLAAYKEDAYILAAIGGFYQSDGYKLADEIIKTCSDIYQIDEYQIRITFNIGISFYTLDTMTKEELIKHADIAMTQARMQGINEVKEYNIKLSEALLRRNSIELMLRKVNYNQEFLVYYQPQLQTHNKKIIGFEALLRWRTPKGEWIGPNEFIPVAEETGCIIPIGDWVMKSVMGQLVTWNKQFNETIIVGINVSLKQLNSNQFIDSLKQEINRLRIQPEWVDLEITETCDLLNNPDVLKILSDIRKSGITVSIDDFGTGYSSLSYFKELPVDRIKLARELVQNIHVNGFDYQLVKSIIQLSKTKGIKVIAEGVETEEQWKILKDLQCDEVQGYFFGRPMPTKEAEAVLLERR